MTYLSVAKISRRIYLDLKGQHISERAISDKRVILEYHDYYLVALNTTGTQQKDNLGLRLGWCSKSINDDGIANAYRK